MERAVEWTSRNDDWGPETAVTGSGTPTAAAAVFGRPHNPERGGRGLVSGRLAPHVRSGPQGDRQRRGMTDAPGSRVPKYLRTADQLRAAVNEGTYQPGDRLPGEDALAVEFGVSPNTVSRALELLKQDGTVEGRRGSGVYVQPRTLIRRHGASTAADSQWGSAARIWEAEAATGFDVDQVSTTKAAPTTDVAGLLELAHGEGVLLSRVRHVRGGRPVKLVDIYLPEEIVMGTSLERSDAAPADIQAVLAESGRPAVHVRQEVRVRMPSSEEAERLAIPVGRAVIDEHRTYFDAERKIIGVERAIMDSASHVLENEFDL
ncbi:GntR family transcriptional regulator [Streptomyces goshikiensis]|uniref:GntR family transcriptional regulator n=1 Tax=Streptomyces goshikiensis TaxID=1942 RepID=UPI0036A0D700